MAEDTANAGATASEAASGAANVNQPSAVDPETAAKIAGLRAAVRENFGKAVMAMMTLPRYRAQTLADLQHLVLEPIMRDRLVIAYPGDAKENLLKDMAGIAIWASVSEAVDARIREQIKEGVFPIRLKSEDWTSGHINWLLDVVAPNPRTTAAVIANFRKVAKEGELRLHPIITRLVDQETLEKMGARRTAAAAAEATAGAA